MRYFATVLLLSLPAIANASLVWHWEADFSTAERGKLTSWIEQTFDALERYAGPFPFDVHVHMDRHSRGGEPVPWANTWRNDRQSVFFYVDTSYTLDEFLDDWTAAHELSHLILPYMGRSNAWFAEGFASHLQFTIMIETGVIDAAEARRRRQQRSGPAVAMLEGESKPLPENMDSLRARRNMRPIYWGGAVYWERVDARLVEEGGSLQAGLKTYLACCRMQRRSLDDLVGTLDRLTDSRAFSEELAIMRTAPGYPQGPTYEK